MVDPTPHTSLEDLTAFSLGTLVGEEAATVERHMSECRQCTETLLNLASADDTFIQMLRDARQENSAEEQPPELIDHQRYEIVELIGVGGMGNVYRARHRMMDRDVAIKVINRRMVGNPRAVERFHREVKSAARLAHANIVTAFDAEQAGDVHFLAMEYVNGTNLASVVESRGPLPVSEACDYICQAAAGLQHAHDDGMVHRDIKPHNLMLTPDGTVKILDFGLAALSEGLDRETDANSETRTGLTDVGSIMGTPDYISPEQADDAHRVDNRSDIYSLGATLYFLLAGKPPFEGGSVTEVLDGHARLDPPRIESACPDIPLPLADTVTRMMAKRPDDRLQSAGEVISALQPFVQGETTQVRRGVQSRRRILIAVSCLLVIGAAIVVAMSPPNRGDQDASNTKSPIKSLKPKSTVTKNSTPPGPNVLKAFKQLKLTLIEPGQFRMGTERHRKATPDEHVHFVAMTKPFHIGTYEVTQQQFEWVMGRNPSRFTTARAPELVKDLDTGRLPVENVSWDDAVEFCRRLSALPEARRAGYLFRLPTEAEWEYACQAGTDSSFHFGNFLNGKEANVDGRHPWGIWKPGPSIRRTVIVGSYPANPFGLHDMHGNVWEWCADWYQLNYYTQSPPQDPPGPATGTNRVVRGGGWDWGAMHARTAARGQREPGHRDHSLGFRVVRVTTKNRDESAR